MEDCMRLMICALLGLTLGLLTACATLGARSDAQGVFDKGVVLFNQGRYAEAIPLFQRATELDADLSDLAVCPGFPVLQHGLRGGDGSAAVHRLGRVHLDSGAPAA